MRTYDYTAGFSETTDNEKKKEILNTLFITENRLQTLFDNHIPEVSLKQFMLLAIVGKSEEKLTFTQLGNALGCSRQNIKKLADVLLKKGFVTIEQSPNDSRALCINLTDRADRYFRHEFSLYEKGLGCLFAVYSDEEIDLLYRLLSKIDGGIKRLEEGFLNGFKE